MRGFAAWGLCGVLCWAAYGCNRELRPRELPGTMTVGAGMDAAAPPSDARPSDGGAGSAEARRSDAGGDARLPSDAGGDARSPSDAADAVRPPPPPAHQDGGSHASVAVIGGCDRALVPQRSLDGTTGTLPAPGPYRPCGVLGGQSFSQLLVSADGRRVAGLGAGGQVQVLDGLTLAPLATLARARGPYESFAISANGGFVAAANQRDGELDVWRVDDQTLMRAVQLRPVWSPGSGAVAISADGALAAASVGPDTTVVQVASGTSWQLPQSSASCCASALRFVDGGRRLAVARFGFWSAGTGSGNVWLHELATGTAVNLITHNDIYGSVQLEASADGTMLLTSSATDGIGIWDAATGIRRANPTPPANVTVEILGLNTFGDEVGLLVTDPSTQGGPWLQRRRSSDFSLVFEIQIGGLVAPWALASRGNLLVGHTPDFGVVHRLVAVDAFTPRLLSTACSTLPISYPGMFSRDGSRLLADSRGIPAVIDVASGQLVGALFDTARGAVATLSPDGRWIAWAFNQAGSPAAYIVPEFQLAEVETGAQRMLRGQQAWTSAYEMLAFSADSRRLAALNTQDGTLDVADVASGQLLNELALGIAYGQLLGFTDDGAALRIWLPSGEVQTIGWQDGTRTASWILPAGVFNSAVGGTVVANLAPPTVTISREGTPVASLPALMDNCVGGFPSAHLSPDGSLVALANSCSRPQSSTRMWPLTELRHADSGALIQSLPFSDLVLSWDTAEFASGATLWCR